MPSLYTEVATHDDVVDDDDADDVDDDVDDRHDCHLRHHLAISIHGSRHSQYDSYDVDDDRHEEC